MTNDRKDMQKLDLTMLTSEVNGAEDLRKTSGNGRGQRRRDKT